MQLPRISRAQQVAERLRVEIAALPPAARLPAESALAKRFGVSVNTLREALSVLAQEGRIDRRHGAGTFVATPPPARHVGLWYGWDALYSQSGASQRLFSHLQAELGALNLPAKLYLATGAHRDFAGDLVCEDCVRDILAQRVSALAVVSGRVAPAVWTAVQQQRVPVVGMPVPDIPPTVAIGVDTAAMIRQGLERLRAAGCRRVAYLTWLDERAPAARNAAVLAEFRAAAAAANLPVDPEWLRGNLHPTLPGAGYELLREIWSARAEKPDGLLVGDDTYLPDIVSAIHELRIAVPEQLQMVVVANRGVTLCPFFPIDRLEVDLTAHARIMAATLARLARGEPVRETRVTLPWELIESGVVTSRARQAMASAPVATE